MIYRCCFVLLFIYSTPAFCNLENCDSLLLSLHLEEKRYAIFSMIDGVKKSGLVTKEEKHALKKEVRSYSLDIENSLKPQSDVTIKLLVAKWIDHEVESRGHLPGLMRASSRYKSGMTLETDVTEDPKSFLNVYFNALTPLEGLIYAFDNLDDPLKIIEITLPTLYAAFLLKEYVHRFLNEEQEKLGDRLVLQYERKLFSE